MSTRERERGRKEKEREREREGGAQTSPSVQPIANLLANWLAYLYEHALLMQSFAQLRDKRLV